MEENRKKALDLQLNFIVDQTEKYSSWLAESLAVPPSSGPTSVVSAGGSSPVSSKPETGMLKCSAAALKHYNTACVSVVQKHKGP